MQGYAYILMHPGIPCILFEHAFSWGLQAQLAKLVHIRHRSGVCRNSTVKILCAEDDMCVSRPRLMVAA
jgi:alpha-amylase